jgi:hydrogenase-4 component F
MPKGDVGWGALLPMIVLFGLILTMGVAVPQPISHLLQSATAVVLDDHASVAIGAPWQTPDPLATQPSSGNAQPLALATDTPSHMETNP